jgi:hypothetical protein
LALASLFQLSFTFQAKSFEKEALEFAKKKSARNGANEKDIYRRYIDSLGNKDYYSFLGMVSYTYYECKQREINLCLDLRGGMNVILEVEKDAIIKVLANDPSDADLIKALEKANIETRDKGTEYVEAFASAFKGLAKDRKLSVLFVKGNNSQIKAESDEPDNNTITSFSNPQLSSVILSPLPSSSVKSVEDCISLSVPSEPHQNHHALFKFARCIKTLEALEMRQFEMAEHVAAFDRWHCKAKSLGVLKVGQSRDQYLMEYLEGFLSLKSTYRRHVGAIRDLLSGFADSLWGNSSYRPSTSGNLMLYNKAPVMWNSKVQKTTALSMAEAEYYATSTA